MLYSAFPSLSLAYGTDSVQGWPRGTGWALLARGSPAVPDLLLAQADPYAHAHVLEPIGGEGLSVCGVSNTTCEHSPCLQEAAGAQPSLSGNLPGAACTDELIESNYPRLPTILPSFQNKHTISGRKISVAIYTSALIFLPSFLPSNYGIRGREKQGWPFG